MENTNNLDKLATILTTKIEEGLEELPKLAIKTEEFTICLNNILSSVDLVNKITYRPKPITPNEAETKTIS